MINRRHLLSHVSLAALLTAPGLARAFAIQELSHAELEEIRNACRQDALFHAELVAEVEAMLDKQGLSDEQRTEILRGLTCPRCGCPPYLL